MSQSDVDVSPVAGRVAERPPSPEPTPGLRERIEALDHWDAGEPHGAIGIKVGFDVVNRDAVLREIDAALAASPDR